MKERHTLFRREDNGLRLYLNKTKRNYVVMRKDTPIVVTGYSFSINKKFYGFVVFNEANNRWVSFDVYTGKKLAEGDSRKTAVLNTVEALQKIGFEQVFNFVDDLKKKGHNRGVNSRALRL